MDYSELLMKRRSIRDFEKREVPEDVIREIISESCMAPSAGNRQPWKFIIINNREVIKRLSDESKKNILAAIEADPNSPSKQYREIMKLEEYNVFYNAPCLIIIVGPRKNPLTRVDCALLASYFMFSAVQRGLGTCWINLGSDIRDPALLSEIGMPPDHLIVAPLILGYPKEIPAPTPRNEPDVLKYIS